MHTTLAFPSNRRARVAVVAAAVTVGLTLALAPSSAHAAANIAVDDVYTVSSGAGFTAAANVGLLAKDLGLDPAVVVSIETDPAHGTVTSIGDDGAFSYTATDGFVGTDSFDYCIKTAVDRPCASPVVTAAVHVISSIERIGGADRYVVSAGIAAKEFPARVSAVVVASGENFPDALSASAAAGANETPVLLVTRDSIPAVIAAELTNLKPEKIILVGGTKSISAEVEAALHAYVGVGDVVRIGGADRYVVSAAISQTVFPIARPVAYIASGEGFPDALSGSAAAGVQRGPVLLVQKDSIPAAVATELARLVPGKIVVLGGTNAVSDSVVAKLQMTAVTSRVAGADRFIGSAKVSESVFLPTDTHTVYVSSGETFPDALSGSAAAATHHAPVLLVAKNSISAEVAAELDRLEPTRIVVLGGTGAVSDAVYEQLKSHLG